MIRSVFDSLLTLFLVTLSPLVPLLAMGLAFEAV